MAKSGFYRTVLSNLRPGVMMAGAKIGSSARRMVDEVKNPKFSDASNRSVRQSDIYNPSFQKSLLDGTLE